MKRRSLFIGLLILFLVPFCVDAESKTVKTQEELKSALEDTTVTEIVLGSDIDTTGKINITRDVAIDGNGHAITYVGKFFSTLDGEGVEDNTIWSKKSSDGTAGAVYVLQVYQCKVTLKDITLIGGNRGLGVNGGEVTLESSIGFANNGFQDIELSHGTGVDVSLVSTLKLAKDVVIVTDGEVEEDITTWLLFVDDQDGAIVKQDGTTDTITKGSSLKSSELAADLIILYPNAEEATVVGSDLFADSKTNGTKLGLGFVDENGEFLYAWEFLGEDIVTPMDVNTKITFTNEAPNDIQEDLSKVVTNYQNLSYLNFEHNGVLPGKATVSFDVSSKYAVGTKLYVAHFNETTGMLENVQEVTVDDDGSISIEVTECSSYVLYTGIAGTNNTNTNNTTVENAKTGDINLIFITSLVVLAGAGLVVTSKKILAKVK